MRKAAGRVPLQPFSFLTNYFNCTWVTITKPVLLGISYVVCFVDRGRVLQRLGGLTGFGNEPAERLHTDDTDWTDHEQGEAGWLRVTSHPSGAWMGHPECPAATPSVGLDTLDCLGEVAEAGFGVTVEHGGAGFEEERVLQAGEASSLSAFEHDDRAARSTSRIGIPAMSDLGLSRASGLTTSLAPMTTTTSVEGNSGLICSIS